MRKIREALRLRASGLSTGKIAASLGVGQSTASEYLKRIERAALTWPLASDMTDTVLEALLIHPIGGVSRLVEFIQSAASAALSRRNRIGPQSTASSSARV